MIIQIIGILFQVYMIMLFVRILSSWVPEFQQHKLMQFLMFYTDPYLNLFRRFIPPIGMIDISPIVAFLCLGVIERIVVWLVTGLIR